MPRITPQHWKELERVFIGLGFIFVRQTSSHRMYEKEGCLRPLVIPTYESISAEIINGLIRSAGITRDIYFAELNK